MLLVLYLRNFCLIQGHKVLPIFYSTGFIVFCFIFGFKFMICFALVSVMGARYELKLCLVGFCIRIPNCSASFAEKTILSLLKCFHSFVENQLPLYMYQYLSGLTVKSQWVQKDTANRQYDLHAYFSSNTAMCWLL